MNGLLHDLEAGEEIGSKASGFRAGANAAAALSSSSWSIIIMITVIINASSMHQHDHDHIAIYNNSYSNRSYSNSNSNSNRSYDKLSKFIYYYQQDLRVHMFEVTKDEAKEVTNLVGFVWARFEFQSTTMNISNISKFQTFQTFQSTTMNMVNIISFIILTGNGDTGIRPLWAESETIGQILPDCIW